jgi:hypothetical protein
VKKLPQNKGLRKTAKYRLELTSHDNLITRLWVLNASSSQCTYHLYTEDEHELIRGVAEAETIIDQPLSIRIFDSQYVTLVIKDSETRTMMESKRYSI